MRPEDVARFLAQDSKGQRQSELELLTEQELEVFSILSQGYSSSQLCSEFGFDSTALKKIKSSIQKKLGLRSEIELLRRAVKQRLSGG